MRYTATAAECMLSAYLVGVVGEVDFVEDLRCAVLNGLDLHQVRWVLATTVTTRFHDHVICGTEHICQLLIL